jgi:hypothetical protein
MPETVGSRGWWFLSTSISKLEYDVTSATDAGAFSTQVVVLQRMKAVLSVMQTSSKGTAKWVEHWKAGLPHAFDLQLLGLTSCNQ